VGKHRSNPQYFKGKKLQNEIFNQLNIKKVKSIKIIFEKINEKKKKNRESWKKNEKVQNNKKVKKKKEKKIHCELLL